MLLGAGSVSHEMGWWLVIMGELVWVGVEWIGLVVVGVGFAGGSPGNPI